jgi:hypothetical protein
MVIPSLIMIILLVAGAALVNDLIKAKIVRENQALESGEEMKESGRSSSAGSRKRAA